MQGKSIAELLYKDADRRDTDERLDDLIAGQARLADVVTIQHAEQAEQFKAMIEAHEHEHHREYSPDHHEQHGRLSAWFRRIDSIWDNIFKAVGLFMLMALGYGLLVVAQMKMGVLS